MRCGELGGDGGEGRSLSPPDVEAEAPCGPLAGFRTAWAPCKCRTTFSSVLVTGVLTTVTSASVAWGAALKHEHTD